MPPHHPGNLPAETPQATAAAATDVGRTVVTAGAVVAAAEGVFREQKSREKHRRGVDGGVRERPDAVVLVFRGEEMTPQEGSKRGRHAAVKKRTKHDHVYMAESRGPGLPNGHINTTLEVAHLVRHDGPERFDKVPRRHLER